MTPGGLSKSVKHTNRASALEYDEMIIHVMGWVIMKSEYANANENSDNMISG